MFTLTLVFNKTKSHVLMCSHRKFGKLNYIGGKVNELESPIDASYRELYEETGISKEDIDLIFVKHENSTICESRGKANTCSLFVTAGVLKDDVELVEEKNPLVWVRVDDLDSLIHNTYGDGNCYTFLLQSLKRLS